MKLATCPRDPAPARNPRGSWRRGVAVSKRSGMSNYKVHTGIDYAGKRAEPGDVISDLPNGSIAWLLEQGIIEKIESTTPKPPSKSEPKSPKSGDDE